MKRTFDFLNKCVGSSFYAALVSFLTLLLGALASLYTKNITSAFPLSRTFTPWSLFSVVVLLWMALFYFRQAVQSENVRTLQSTTRDILQSVQTLPPKKVLDQFSLAVTAIHTELMAPFPRQTSSDNQFTPDDFERIIRVLLSTIVQLAKLYDTRADARYGANVMIYVERQTTEPYFPGIEEEEIRQFWPGPLGLDQLRGVLCLRKELSVASTSSKEPTPDDHLETVIFGIPSMDFNVDKECWEEVLPGAPLAIAKWNYFSQPPPDLRKAIHGLDDIRDIGRLNNREIGSTKFALHWKIVEGIKKYYEETDAGRLVRSFQAYPLAEGTAAAFGVLNLHCDRPQLLGRAEGIQPHEAEQRQDLFNILISPIVFEIATIVRLWLGTTNA